MSISSIQVTIVDDHPMVVEGLQKMLKGVDHIEIQSIYRSGNTLLMGLKEKQPDVLLLDIHLTDYIGEDLVPIIVKDYPTIRILAITSIDTTSRVRNLIRKGCLGYLLKNASSVVLIKAIKSVYNGTPFIEDELKEQLFLDMLRIKKEMPTQQLFLTRREKEILQLIAREYTSKEIADELFISINTVENHRKHLFQKMDVKNLAGLMRKALILGLVE